MERATRKDVLVWLVGVVSVLALCTAAMAGSVRLRGSARVDGPGPVTLGMVASLEGVGDDAAGIVVVEDPASARGEARWLEIGIEDVRRALDEAGIGAARVAVSGSSCVVRFVGAPVGQDEEPAGKESKVRRPTVVAERGSDTVRGHVVELLETMFGVEGEELRVLFEERDEALLATRVWGRRVVVRPGTGAGSSRVLVDVRVFSGESMVDGRTISVEVEVLRRVLVLEREIERHGVIGPGDVREVEMWVSPRGAEGLETAAEVVGRRARRVLRAGEVLESRDTEAAMAIKKGEMVQVYCLRGGIGVQARGRALESGAIGDSIECRLVSSKSSFVGRVDGEGRVVVVLD